MMYAMKERIFTMYVSGNEIEKIMYARKAQSYDEL